MNPFLLPGPQFLILFGLLVVAVFAASWWAQQVVADSDFGNPRQEPVPPLTDPYEIALLRGGAREALHVGLVALASRGAAHVANGQVATDIAPLEDAHTFERAIAQEIGGGSTVPVLEKSATLRNRLGQVTESLVSKGLLMSGEQRAVSIAVLATGSIALVITASIKVWVAAITGHGNVGFLILLATGAAIGIPFFLRRTRTRRGDAALAARREEWLESASGSGSLHGDVAMGSAILGLGIAPAALQPFVSGIQTRPDSGGAACGGGGGCGGDGGCGGGCGGCGGCGG